MLTENNSHHLTPPIAKEDELITSPESRESEPRLKTNRMGAKSKNKKRKRDTAAE